MPAVSHAALGSTAHVPHAAAHTLTAHERLAGTAGIAGKSRAGAGLRCHMEAMSQPGALIARVGCSFTACRPKGTCPPPPSVFDGQGVCHESMFLMVLGALLPLAAAQIVRMQPGSLIIAMTGLASALQCWKQVVRQFPGVLALCMQWVACSGPPLQFWLVIRP